MFEGMEAVELEDEGTLLRGYAALPGGAGPFPTVLVMHTALGISHAMNEPVARALATEGYAAFCIDMYGVGRTSNENHDKPDRERARTVAWFDTIAARPDIDDQRIAAIGSCQGGTYALELARSGAKLCAAVSYHGTLTTHARAEVGIIRGHLVAYCGANDPFCPVEDVEAFREEMRVAGVSNYQTTIFGSAKHGFMDPKSEPAGVEGIQYDELAHDVSWSGTLALLRHLFGS
jgi:dienelactone hydrolase